MMSRLFGHRNPMRIGLPGLTCMSVSGIVLGPDDFPAITSLNETGRDVEFVVLAAPAHSQSRKIGGILESRPKHRHRR
jgi:hypothetical protein